MTDTPLTTADLRAMRARAEAATPARPFGRFIDRLAEMGRQYVDWNKIRSGLTRARVLDMAITISALREDLPRALAHIERLTAQVERRCVWTEDAHGTGYVTQCGEVAHVFPAWAKSVTFCYLCGGALEVQAR